jgi:biotin transport system substrate-specific component
MNVLPHMSHAVRTEQSVVQQIMWIAGFAVATAIGARVEIPHQPVPYTLQTFVVLLAGAFLGPRNGAISQVAYLTAGLLGAPVFSGGGFGIERLLGPTGGYLLAFPMAATVTGFLTRQSRTLVWSFISMAAGLLVIFTSGTIQLYAVMFRNWGGAFSAGFLIFSWWDILKLSAAALIYHKSV